MARGGVGHGVGVAIGMQRKQGSVPFDGIHATRASFGVTGFDANFLSTTVIPMGQGSFAMTGQAITFLSGGGEDDVTAPTVSSFSPGDNTTGVATDANISVTFSEPIQFGATVSVSLFLTDDTPVESWDEGDIASGISISAATLSISPSSDLTTSQGYYIQITSGSIEDLAGNAFTGITDETTWNFTTGLGDIGPAAPIASWTSNPFDFTPNFDIQLPTGLGDATDAAVDDVIHAEYDVAGNTFNDPTTYFDHTLISGDLDDPATISVTGVTPLTPDADYEFRFRLERAGVGNSDYSTTVDVTLTSPSEATKELLGGQHSGGGGGQTLTHVFTVGTDEFMALVAFSGRIGDAGGASDGSATITVDCASDGSGGSSSAMTVDPDSYISEGYTNGPQGFAYKTVTSSTGFVKVVVDFDTNNNNQLRSFFMWKVVGLPSDTPAAGAAQLNHSTVVGSNYPAEIAVLTGQFAFAISQTQGETNCDYQNSTPPAEKDFSTDGSAYTDNAYHNVVAAEWEIGADGTLTVEVENGGGSQSNNNCTRSVISFATS